MLADALAQYLGVEEMVALGAGLRLASRGRAAGRRYRRAAKRFGARIVKEREFKDTGGARQTDSGVVQTQQQMPVFTQGLPDYDVLVAADENARVRRLSAVSHLGRAPGRGLGRIAAGDLGSGQRVRGAAPSCRIASCAWRIAA